jgi:uroporphyrinogen decarboxylase
VDKRERLERAVVGEAVDRVPVALWRPWPGDDQRPSDLARCLIDFQRDFDWDFLVMTPSPSYPLVDYGYQDEWQGAADGTRVMIKSPVKRSLDWTELRTLDPARGELAKQIMCLRLVIEALPNVPILMTIYSPLAQAHRLARTAMLSYLRRQPDRLRTGLNILAESTLRLIDALKPLEGLSGLYYVVEHADYEMLSEVEYASFGFADDQKILETLPRHWWLNIVYLHGESPMFHFAQHYPVQCVNWHDRCAQPTLPDSRTLMRGAACGGVDALRDLLHGNADECPSDNSVRRWPRYGDNAAF